MKYRIDYKCRPAQSLFSDIDVPNTCEWVKDYQLFEFDEPFDYELVVWRFRRSWDYFKQEMIVLSCVEYKF